MSSELPLNQDRSVSIGGSMTNGVIITGDENTGSIQIQQANLLQPESINIQYEILALRELLSELKSTDQRKIERAFEDAEEESKKSEPDKDEIGQALERALNYAEKANGFAESVDKLRPHIEKIAAWLGENWYKLLTVVGLAV